MVSLAVGNWKQGKSEGQAHAHKQKCNCPNQEKQSESSFFLVSGDYHSPTYSLANYMKRCPEIYDSNSKIFHAMFEWFLAKKDPENEKPEDSKKSRHEERECRCIRSYQNGVLDSGKSEKLTL
tara:strand:- start:1415 stop:1783 length:369 start_codon:yes stop_codon:yes gene_type:complete